MRLHRVKLFGFKTFADRAEFQLGGGVVAVVGPNGCGKSNLVDAILWGLGEGSVRHLRASQAQDVIFGGSSRRKPIGFAEVQLTFDNSDGALPVDSSEVEVSRRLDRGGETEYRINRHPCRLKDVHDLLADSGLGRAGYAIVGQKEIDQALSATPEQRRDWIDEAAGVQRYRLRKQDALRRLASARTHLERVDDILRELEHQREPLKEEAIQATRYRELQSSLQSIELGLLCKELRDAIAEIKVQETKIANAAGMARLETERAEELEREIAAVGERISAVEREMDTVRGLQQAAITAFERADADLRLAQERLRGLDALQSTLVQEDEGAVRAERESELIAAQGALEEDRALLSLAEASLAESSGVIRAAKSELAKAEHELQSGRAMQREQLRAQLEFAQRKDRHEQIQRELAGLERTLPELELAHKEAGLAHAVTVEALEGRRLSEAKRSQISSDLLSKIESLQHDRRGQLAELAAVEGRRRGIQATIDAHEGLHQGPKAILEATSSGELEGRFVPLAAAISVPEQISLAIEVALGHSAGDLIVDTNREAKAAIEFLRRTRRGRATIHPIDLMRPVETSPELRKLLVRPGVLGIASHLVQFDPADRLAIESLLGRILVVETLDLALAMAKTTGWHRIVTLTGEVVASSGAVTGGAQERQGMGLVQRHSAMESLESQAIDLQRAIDRLDSEIQSVEESRKALSTEAASEQDSQAALDRDEAEARQFLQTLAEELRDAHRERDRLLKEAAGLSASPAVATKDIDLGTLEWSRDAAQATLAELLAKAEAGDSRVRDLRLRVSCSVSRFEAARRACANLDHAAKTRAQRLEGIGPTRQQEIATAAKAEDARAKAELDQKEALARLDVLQSMRAQLLEQNLRLAESTKETSRNISGIAEATHQAEINRARADSKRANITERLIEDYGIDEAGALDMETQPLPADASTIVARLRKELRAMGVVNLGAIEAYERLTQRFEELAAQKADIDGSIEHIRSSIKELDELTRGRFTETFEAVGEAFARLFARLFGGGEGRLRLTDGGNLLESGIDLDVVLPGKKKQLLNLLSGGERSLCAVAFLFALLEVKPTPLVVLDEVDAPLDGRNVERFADLLAEFSDRLQFIVITHNPTTIARADTWLGVTMQEPGVSTLAPVRVPPSPPERELASLR